jgi:acetyltransferase-like isoleucine patch superfamily enzyme
MRWLWYNLTVFGFHRPVPWSTTFYGRVETLLAPCRVRFGRRCRVGSETYFATSLTSTIEIGDGVTINKGCVLVSIDRITIGSQTAIAEYVSIRDQEHRFDTSYGVRGTGYASAPVTIGKNVWIGRGVYIGPGTTIGDGCIIGANSVVRGTFPGNVLIAGAPGTVKRILMPGQKEDRRVLEGSGT